MWAFNHEPSQFRGRFEARHVPHPAFLKRGRKMREDRSQITVVKIDHKTDYSCTISGAVLKRADSESRLR